MDRQKQATRLGELLTRSYTELSDETGISRSTFSKWKSGDRSPSRRKLRQLAEVARERGRLLVNEATKTLTDLADEDERVDPNQPDIFGRGDR